jgi:hypothetical protein
MFIFCCLMFINSFCLAQDDSNFRNIYSGARGFEKAKPFKATPLKQSYEKEDKANRTTVFLDNERNQIKVIWSKSGSGVFLIDKTGNKLSSISKGLFTEMGPKPSLSTMEVVTADLNKDGTNDFFIVLRAAGNGMVNEDQSIFFLSFKKNYIPVFISTYLSGTDCLVNLKNNGQCFFIARQLINNPGVKIPPKENDEIPAPPKNFNEISKKSYYNFMSGQLYFEVIYPYLVTGATLKEACNINNIFPIFNPYIRGEIKSLSETKLLTETQKKNIWKKNIIGFTNQPIRDKQFMMNNSRYR